MVMTVASSSTVADRGLSVTKFNITCIPAKANFDRFSKWTGYFGDVNLLAITPFPLSSRADPSD
jgi:hypothetical protein